MGQPIRVRWTCSSCKKELEEDFSGLLERERGPAIARSDAYVRRVHREQQKCSGTIERLDR